MQERQLGALYRMPMVERAVAGAEPGAVRIASRR